MHADHRHRLADYAQLVAIRQGGETVCEIGGGETLACQTIGSLYFYGREIRCAAFKTARANLFRDGVNSGVDGNFLL